MIPRYDLSGEIMPGASAEIGLFCADNAGPVQIYINSFGGLATEGAAIHAALEQHGQVTAIIQGVAASAASLAMLGAKRVLIHAAALVMIHNPSGMAVGEAQDLRSAADTLDKLAVLYASIYARSTGNPVARISAWMRDETWMTADEAVALNFADAVVGGDNSQPIAVAAFDYTRFTAAPSHLVTMARQNGWATVSPDTGTKEKTDA